MANITSLQPQILNDIELHLIIFKTVEVEELQPTLYSFNLGQLGFPNIFRENVAFLMNSSNGIIIQFKECLSSSMVTKQDYLRSATVF